MTKSFLKIIAAILAIIMLWAGAMATDYLLVFEKEEKPVFCISAKVRKNTTIYNGVGYSYTFIYDGENTKQVWFENFLNANQYWITYY